MKRLLTGLLLFFVSTTVSAQSVARQWNEEVLNGIRNDFARPTVHARNLFHTSVAMYDAWAVFDEDATPFFLGKTVGGYKFDFDGFSTSEEVDKAKHEAISYAVFRIMLHRFSESPRSENIIPSINELMESFGYNTNYRDTNYKNGNPAALGNYIASEIIKFGLQDGSNEAGQYENLYYQPLNDPLNTDIAGNPNMEYPNNWQPLRVENYVDQGGNSIPGGQPPFLSPEWGIVIPFALKEDDLSIYSAPDFDFYVYHDPGPPPFIQDGLGIEDDYKWGFTMVAVWGAHLGAEDQTMIDISPATLGNVSITSYPKNFDEYRNFYNFIEGGDPSRGRTINPSTGQPYEKQMVLRSDYTRVLAEFWADGPDSETPPGHWFTILNYVNDQPELEKKFGGRGTVLSELEWDIKAYFVLGGAMHDAAISAWGIKGYYDYVRPISAIRYMADQGQSTDVSLSNYHPHGIPLVPGYVETVEEGDPLVGNFNEHLGKIKLYTWRGPDYIPDPNSDIAGIGWILAEDWFPYQRPSFVTPPFAGYVSGHSTYSRAAAEVLTLLTGDEYFPGGKGVFDIPKDEFLQFEKGPTEAFQLQWATYRDASDQTSLSRIWGGIHPAFDDIPGRIIGEKVGVNAFEFAQQYFNSKQIREGIIFPNPANEIVSIGYASEENLKVCIYDLQGRKVMESPAVFNSNQRCDVDVSALSQGVYILQLATENDIVFTKRLLKN